MSEGDLGAAGGQLQLLVINDREHNPAAPPLTRGECAGIARPCNRYACVHNLLPETERAGRPHHGTHPHATLRHDAIDSCELDVADRGRQTPTAVGVQLGLTPERVRQLEDRAMRKTALALKLEETIEELRANLGGKCAIETAYPRTNDPNRVCVVVVVMKVEEQSSYDTHAPPHGVQVRRRAK